MARIAAALVSLAVALLAAPGCGAAGPDSAGAAPSAEPAASSDASPGEFVRLEPGDLVYAGAFRLPDASGGSSWDWSGQALAYWPGGDPDGPDDGHPGSLFGVGHDHQAFVSEISIPRPVVSKAKNPEALPRAKTLQPFTDIRGGRFGDFEMYRVGLAILPPAGARRTPKLVWCWGQHMQERVKDATHGWSELTLARPRSSGCWKIDDYDNYTTCDYLFPIPADWAAAHTPGMTIATGRFRDGGQGGLGPSIIAFAPPESDEGAPDGTKLEAKPLLLYETVYEENPKGMRDYHHSDDWSGASWVRAAGREAVVFVGTKGTGKCWYGFANGVVWPEEGPWPPVPDYPNDQRGWWSTAFVGRMLFYDPKDLAAVADGKRKPHEPQPYATMDLDPLLFGDKSGRKMRHLGPCAFDPSGGHLYVQEYRGDEDRSLIHVWTVRGAGGKQPPATP